jgi:PTH1 family peptidyl-tRNA hydrolase
VLVLAGLGNPEAKYQNNRHNIGFMAMNAISRRWRVAAA